MKVPAEKAQICGSYLGQPVAFGIRPEYIHDAKRFSTHLQKNALQASVEIMEPLGSEAIIYFKTNGQSLVGRLDADTDVDSGQNLEIYLGMAKMHLFDPHSGELIQ